MRSFLIKRILQAVSVVVCISALTFFVLNIVPGDPVRVMMGDMADEATVQQVRHTMGLDKPIPEQYANWFVKMLGGDFGTSYTQKRPVIALLTKALGVTLRLAVFAYLFAIVLGLLMGILAAVNHGKWLDRTTYVCCNLWYFCSIVLGGIGTADYFCFDTQVVPALWR
ncbi:MAG: ABC transporter permease [Lancefieldella parvula]|uniref:ABC transporter permease n=1 Tax=Lancefieldella parvula TaxID=1382 RepID=A0A9E7ACK1_9ACTN|nr:MAG: ABC transporter permease [Lancefieldella parvula]